MNTHPLFKQFNRKGREVLRLRPSLRSYWRSWLIGIFIVALWKFKKKLFEVVTSSIGIPTEFSTLGLIIGLTPVVSTVLFHRYTRAYEIEDERKLSVTVGFISQDKREFNISDKIQADMTQTIPGRLLNFGTIAFWTGDQQSHLVWQNVPAPNKILRYIDTLKYPEKYQHEQSSGSSTNSTNVSNNSPTLADAKRSKSTHFGSASKIMPDTIRKRIKTPFGNYIDNGDGTVSHEETSRMWVRAPWGMSWDKQYFSGEPIKLDWSEAARLFGRGTNVGYQVGSTKAFFDREKRTASAFHNGYKLGKCRINFAGFQDWRLATADDLQLMSASAKPFPWGDGDHDPSDHNLTNDEAIEWAWLKQKNKTVISRLFPEFFDLTSRKQIFLWSATELGDGLAWAYDGAFPVGDFKNKSPFGVMFVRQGTKSDYAAHSIEDETY